MSTAPNNILKKHPCFFDGTKLQLIQKNQSNALVLLRHHLPSDQKLLVLVNLDCKNNNDVIWCPEDTMMNAVRYHDLLTFAVIDVQKVNNNCLIGLLPGEVMVICDNESQVEEFKKASEKKYMMPQRVLLQKLKDRVLKIYNIFNGYGNVAHLDVEALAMELVCDPLEFIRSLNKESSQAKAVVFHWDRDLKRQVMVPPDFFLLVVCKSGFRAVILEESISGNTILGSEEGLPFSGKEGFFALFAPIKVNGRHRRYKLNLRVFESSGSRYESANLIYLAPFKSLSMKTFFFRKEVSQNSLFKASGNNKDGRHDACCGQVGWSN